MGEGHGCTFNKIEIDGKIYDRVIGGFFEELEGKPDKKCHDCGINNDGKSMHHFGCDMEECPACGGQLLSCDCDKQNVLKA